MTLLEKIIRIDDKEKVVSLKNEYGTFWTGKVKFIFSSVNTESLNSDGIDIIFWQNLSYLINLEKRERIFKQD